MQDKNLTLAEQWANFVVGTRFEDLPADVVHYVKRNILNEIGCALAGKGIRSSDIAAGIAADLGGKPECTVLGYGFKTSCANAAFANAIIAYAVEMNDDHRLGTGHPVVATWPASLAMGERHHASGKDVLTAQALGTEFTIRIGAIFLGFMYHQGFHPTGNCATFGATASAGKVLGLSQEELVNALGVAGSSAAGLAKVTIGSGVWTKRFHGGHASMDGVIAALMGQKGFKGSSQVFEGINDNGGFVQAHAYQGKYDYSKLTDEIGERWELLHTSVKVHACCAYLSPVVDCALEVSQKYNVTPEDVESVDVKVCSAVLDALMKPEERKYKPQDVVDAQFSIPYGVGLAICRRIASPAEFEEACYTDPQILAVASKVRGEVDPVAEERYPDDKLATVVVKTKNGTEYSAHTDYPKGDWENPVSDAELEDKFRILAKQAVSEEKASQIIEMVWRLDELKELNELVDCICDQ